MAKEYFSHDYNARHDRKISALVKDYKSTGYGIFWATCEMMHEEGDRLEFDDLTFHSIAKDLNESEDLIKEVLEKCISKYKLFTMDDILLTSGRVKKNLNGREEKKNAKIEAGRLGGIKSGESRRSKQNEAELEANEAELEATKQIKEKESKLNESKPKKKKENFPVFDSLNGLPKQKSDAAIQQFKFSQNVSLSKEQVDSLWIIFKTQKLTGENYYQSDEKVYDHFISWVKTQKINNKDVIDKTKDKDFMKSIGL